MGREGKKREVKKGGSEREERRRGRREPYLNFKFDRGHIWVRCSHPGVKVHLRIRLSHDLRFEDVATPSIKPKESLIQVHMYVCGKTIHPYHRQVYMKS